MLILMKFIPKRKFGNYAADQFYVYRNKFVTYIPVLYDWFFI